MKLTKPIAFFDIESTGVDPSKDRIVEIAIIRFEDDLMSLGQGTSYRLNPTIKIPQEASDVHGITDEMVKDCSTFKQAYDNILADLEGCDLGTFNGISFDIPMLNAEFARVGINFPNEGTKLVDAFSIYRQKETRTLKDAVKFYLDEELEGAHGAMADTNATVKVFRAQLERYNLPAEINQLDEISRNGRTIVDWGGKFSKDQNGDIIYNFGKHKGKRVKDEPSYADWMLKSDFPEETKKHLREVLKPVAL